MNLTLYIFRVVHHTHNSILCTLRRTRKKCKSSTFVDLSRFEKSILLIKYIDRYLCICDTGTCIWPKCTCWHRVYKNEFRPDNDRVHCHQSSVTRPNPRAMMIKISLRLPYIEKYITTGLKLSSANIFGSKDKNYSDVVYKGPLKNTHLIWCMALTNICFRYRHSLLTTGIGLYANSKYILTSRRIVAERFTFFVVVTVVR